MVLCLECATPILRYPISNQDHFTCVASAITNCAEPTLSLKVHLPT